MIEWAKQPRGSYRLQHDGKEADVWQVFGAGWSWHVFDLDTGHCLASGTRLPNLDAACDQAQERLGI